MKYLKHTLLAAGFLALAAPVQAQVALPLDVVKQAIIGTTQDVTSVRQPAPASADSLIRTEACRNMTSEYARLREREAELVALRNVAGTEYNSANRAYNTALDLYNTANTARPRNQATVDQRKAALDQARATRIQALQRLDALNAQISDLMKILNPEFERLIACLRGNPENASDETIMAILRSLNPPPYPPLPPAPKRRL